MKRRELKKDIDFLVGEVVSDCYTCLMINGEKHHDAIVEIMDTVVSKRNELIERTCKRLETKDVKEVKSYYKAIQQDLLSVVDEGFSKLSEISKS